MTTAFFYYYGAKNRLARQYPAPEYRTIVEPFAGSAAYSLAYHDRDVLLFDLDERVCGVWDYLIRAHESEILALPDLPEGGSLRDLTVCQEAAWLIGWCLSKGDSNPRYRLSPWALVNLEDSPERVWSPECRAKIARQQRHVRHWQIRNASWTTAPIQPCTYFVDPPYEVAGKHYRHSEIDYAALAKWCRESPGQVIACEALGAAWLPFRSLARTQSQGRSGERKGHGRSTEVVWTNRLLTRGRQTQMLELFESGSPLDGGRA